MNHLIAGYDDVPVAAIEHALGRGVELAASGQLQGYRDLWMRIEQPGGTTLLFTVMPRGLRVQVERHRWQTVGKAVRRSARQILAACYLAPDTPAWEQAVTLIESIPERGPLIDTRGD